jgi:hypothetical protein
MRGVFKNTVYIVRSEWRCEYLTRYELRLIIGPGGICPRPCSDQANGLANSSMSGAVSPDALSSAGGYSEGGKSVGSEERMNATDSPI